MIFINYRRDDTKEFAAGLARDLWFRYTEDAVFFDQKLPGSTKWKVEIDSYLAKSTLLICVMGSEWETILKERAKSSEKDYVLYEIQTALKLKKPVYPLLIDAPRPDDALLSSHNLHEIFDKQFRLISLRQPSSYREGLQLLFQDLEKIIGSTFKPKVRNLISTRDYSIKIQIGKKEVVVKAPGLNQTLSWNVPSPYEGSGHEPHFHGWWNHVLGKLFDAYRDLSEAYMISEKCNTYLHFDERYRADAENVGKLLMKTEDTLSKFDGAIRRGPKIFQKNPLIAQHMIHWRSCLVPIQRYLEIPDYASHSTAFQLIERLRTWSSQAITQISSLLEPFALFHSPLPGVSDSCPFLALK